MQIKYKKPDKPEKGVDYYARFLRDRIQEGFVFPKVSIHVPLAEHDRNISYIV